MLKHRRIEKGEDNEVKSADGEATEHDTSSTDGEIIPRCSLIFAQLEECKHNAKKPADSNVIYFHLTVPKASLLHSPKGHTLAVKLRWPALTAEHRLHCRWL